MVVSGTELLRGGADRVQRRQVEFLQRHVRVGTALVDEGGGVFALVQVAHRYHDVCALGGQRGRCFVAESSVRPGDDGDTTGLVGNVGGCPLSHGKLPKL